MLDFQQERTAANVNFLCFVQASEKKFDSKWLKSLQDEFQRPQRTP